MRFNRRNQLRKSLGIEDIEHAILKLEWMIGNPPKYKVGDRVRSITGYSNENVLDQPTLTIISIEHGFHDWGDVFINRYVTFNGKQTDFHMEAFLTDKPQ